MGLLYLFETSLDYHGMTSKELYKLWLKHAGEAFKLYEQGIMKYAFKICGERNVLGVMSVESPSVLDTCFADLPLHQALGDQLHSRFTPLRQYEGFASDVSERAGKGTKYDVEKANLKEGLFYLLTFTVEYDTSMTQQDLLTIWAEEGQEAIKAKKKGIILDLWKVVAERKILAIICVQDPADVDRLSLDLPIMKKMGDRVHIECKSIRPIKEWAEDLKKLAANDSEKLAGPEYSMSQLLYLVDTNIDYKGVPQKDFCKVWAAEAEALLKEKENGKVIQIWKVVGERRTVCVMRAGSPDDIDRLSFQLPLSKEMGDQVHREVTPLRSYEGFATDLNKKLSGDDTVFDDLPTVPKAGLFYWITFTVEYPGKTQDELLALWLQEAKVAMGGKKKGKVVDIWKVLGERKVYTLLCVDSPYEVDRISFDLPFMKQMGDSIHMEVKSVRPYEALYDDLKKLAST